MSKFKTEQEAFWAGEFGNCPRVPAKKWLMDNLCLIDVILGLLTPDPLLHRKVGAIARVQI